MLSPAARSPSWCPELLRCAATPHVLSPRTRALDVVARCALALAVPRVAAPRQLRAAAAAAAAPAAAANAAAAVIAGSAIAVGPAKHRLQGNTAPYYACERPKDMLGALHTNWTVQLF